MPAHAEEITAQACWNITENSDQGDCAQQIFHYGTDLEPTVHIEPSKATSSSSLFVLENLTDGPIDVVLKSCDATWFELDLGPEISTNATCPCSSPDTVKTIAPGDSQTLIWDGRFSYTYPSGCQAQYDLPAEYETRAKLCWRKPNRGPTSCTPLYFKHGQAEPIHVQAR